MEIYIESFDLMGVYGLNYEDLKPTLKIIFDNLQSYQEKLKEKNNEQDKQVILQNIEDFDNELKRGILEMVLYLEPSEYKYYKKTGKKPEQNTNENNKNNKNKVFLDWIFN